MAGRLTGRLLAGRVVEKEEDERLLNGDVAFTILKQVT